ncbi:MAG: Asp-tRNA(Asn)/Glu-tRNA(Gln) amidotransferase GatCAB subunit A [Candidatus Moraniibacteriota bacterium]|nr:MAG: Asp-tRNA(Asn)/Glu-tRNA(Gln) amidotransferase GatCAB subunit A [Candidatus Moranbacteria bacterium]
MIRELHEKLVSGEISAVNLTEEYLKKIAEKDDDFAAFLTVTEELALKSAEEVDKKISAAEKIDLLAGIPCALKDNICVTGVRTTAASKMLDNYIAPYDATVVARVKDVDAVIMGKVNMDEFACGSSTENSAYGPSKNPIDTSRVPGGSSGGSAVAVAGDEVVWALGTDTGGSIRQPASFCGVVGLKPTYGRVSRYGVIAMGSSLDQVGPIAQTVEDVAIVLSRISGRDENDATSAQSGDKPYEDYCVGELAGAKIGIPKEYLGDGLDDRVKEVYMTAIEKYKDLGAEIEEVSLPHTEYALATYYIIMPSELSSNLARFDGIRFGGVENVKPETILDQYLETRGKGFGPEIKRRVMLGTYTLSAGYYDAYYKKAQKVRALIKKDFKDALEKVDYLFTPTAPEVAFKFGAKVDDPLTMYLSDIYTITANLAGVPALSIPIGSVIEDGIDLPVGGQLMGKWFDEEGILNAGYTFEINS